MLFKSFIISALISLNVGSLLGQSVISIKELDIRSSERTQIYATRQEQKRLDGDYRIVEGRRKEFVATFRDGKMHGSYKEYIVGTLQTEGHYQNGLRHGIWRDYFPSSKLRRELQYVLGRREGEEKTYYNNGNLERQTYYIKGEKDGLEKVYDEHGAILRQYNWKHDVKEGAFQEHNVIGQGWNSRVVGNYRSGKLHGAWQCDVFGVKGELKYQIHRLYKEGEIIEEKQTSNSST